VSCGLHDVTNLESAGIPAILMCTKGFIRSVDEQLAVFNFSSYRPVFVEHPIGSLNPEQARERGRQSVAAIVDILLAQKNEESNTTTNILKNAQTTKLEMDVLTLSPTQFERSPNSVLSNNRDESEDQCHT